jgi:importin-5
MRSFSLVLLRRLLFRPSPVLGGSKSSSSSRLTLYDRLSAQTLSAIERILLHSLLHEHVDSVRRKAVDTICDLANNSMGRGRPWHALQAQSFAMCKSADPSARECAFRIFSGCPNLVMDLQTDAVLRVLQEGLQDRQSVEVRLSPYLSCSTHSDHRSGMQLFALLHPISPLPIRTKLHSPYPSCTPCWTHSHLSPTHTCLSS